MMGETDLEGGGSFCIGSRYLSQNTPVAEGHTLLKPKMALSHTETWVNERSPTPSSAPAEPEQHYTSQIKQLPWRVIKLKHSEN